MKTVLFSLSLLLSLPLQAQAADPKKPVCADAVFHQFDFWVGDWDVTTPQGKPAGRNRIQSILEGCAISEEWTGAGGTNGRSHSAWDARNKQWNQYWVADDAGVLYLSGSLRDGSMVLSGEQLDPASGKRSPQRVTWTPNADGSVRQLWESSADGGKTWTTVFEGIYRRRS